MGLNRHRLAAASVGAGLVMVLVISACSGPSTNSGPPPSVGWVDSGSWYVREPWAHDGSPFESRRFVVYSDSASVEARMELAETVERVWDEILTEMSINPDLLAMPPGQNKLDVYAFKDRSPDWAGKAYYGGLIVSSPDRRILFDLIPIDSEGLESTIKHELVHVASESLLHSGGLDEPPWVSVWFFEGVAEVVSRGTGSGAITGQDHFDYLTSNYGHLNPVSYQSDEGIEGGANAYIEYHYPMRRLAVEYLFDDAGYDVPLSEATALLVDVARGTSFDDAFADRIGVTVAEYENQFFDLMEAYLPERSVPIVLAPISLIILSVSLLGAATAATLWSNRSAAGVTAAEKSTAPVRSRGRTIGFAAWITVISLLGLGVFVIGIYSISVSWGLSGLGQVSGMAVMIGYFVGATFAINWAIRSRDTASPNAWLIPLATIIGAAVTAVAIVLITALL